jgi:transposase
MLRLHGNAALSWQGRRRLARRVVVEGWTLTAAAAASGVSPRCARKRVGRYREEGEAGLCDRSSAPRRVANRTPAERVAVIVSLRGLRFTAAGSPRRWRWQPRRSRASSLAGIVSA